MAATATELISVRGLRREEGRYVVEEFDGLGQPTSRIVTDKQGKEIQLQLERAQPDLDRYARLPTCFPVPTTIPVELPR